MPDDDRIAQLAQQVAGLTLAVRALLESHPDPDAALAALESAAANAAVAHATSKYGGQPAPPLIATAVSAWRTCLQVARAARRSSDS